ncbi:deoxyribonuclease V [Pseudoalteromonas sp. DL2-H2.2]|uniref:deoxyribonuclease V n=1 Tax=Pseudoalteromonas sp. DL2-H2.2 TaxID=2908889 RepID=UPI001EEA3316|nr:deoxyribonuclease V [Pseudoalteromonas sp. DL2-H2.2]MCF2910656.1 deoxyribonuclease V [Pseudoalteromonas sp. DL2-H2.2]
MQIEHPSSETEAQALQEALAAQVISEDHFDSITTIAGTDVAYDDATNQLVGAIVVLDASTLEIIETQVVTESVRFPYIPGLFSFRELPPLLSAFERLTHKPDMIVCDGQGLAHPRRFGLACHLGVVLDIPTIGCGKTRLTGMHEMPLETRGASAPLIDNEQVIGEVLRTQDTIKPVYVSVGHKVSLSTAKEWILKLTPKYRLPETTRQADQQVNRALKALQAQG